MIIDLVVSSISILTGSCGQSKQIISGLMLSGLPVYADSLIVPIDYISHTSGICVLVESKESISLFGIGF